MSKTESKVTVVATDAKSLALPRIFDGVASVEFKDGKAEVSPAVAEELKRNYPNLVTVL